MHLYIFKVVSALGKDWKVLLLSVSVFSNILLSPIIIPNSPADIQDDTSEFSYIPSSLGNENNDSDSTFRKVKFFPQL